MINSQIHSNFIKLLAQKYSNLVRNLKEVAKISEIVPIINKNCFVTKIEIVEDTELLLFLIPYNLIYVTLIKYDINLYKFFY